MIKPKPTLHNVGSVIFTIGILLGILIILARSWPDLEATLYGFSKAGYPPLQSLTCPVLMFSNDHQPVTIRLHNPLAQPLSWYINAQFSTPVLITNVDERVLLQPGESRTISWSISKENIDLNNFIFAYVFSSPAAAIKMTESTCGTFVIKLPITGGPTAFYLSMLFAVLFAATGLWLWFQQSDHTNPIFVSRYWWMCFITFVIEVGVIASLLNWWFLGVVILLLTILTLGVSLIPHSI